MRLIRYGEKVGWDGGGIELGEGGGEADYVAVATLSPPE